MLISVLMPKLMLEKRVLHGRILRARSWFEPMLICVACTRRVIVKVFVAIRAAYGNVLTSCPSLSNRAGQLVVLRLECGVLSI